jgi:hypothetical protein
MTESTGRYFHLSIDDKRRLQNNELCKRKIMEQEKIVRFVKNKIEPLPAVAPYGFRYRVSATLTDGTFLPCVVVESTRHTVELAMRQFDEEKKGGIRAILKQSSGYQKIVECFVTTGNRVNSYDIENLQKSKFAIPLNRMMEINGETSMGWTEFYGTMSDGAEFRFGTRFHHEFFDMPPDYSATDIQKIVPAIRGEKPKYEKVYRERPFFTCYIEGL